MDFVSSSSSSSTISGRCLCGKIEYTVSGPPLTKVLCHCENCRRSTGSAFMANNFYRKSQLHIHNPNSNAPLQTYIDTNTDSGNTVRRSFCACCGSHLFITNDSNLMLAEAVVVTTGTMNGGGGSDWAPEREFYCKRRMGWMPRLEKTSMYQEMS